MSNEEKEIASLKERVQNLEQELLKLNNTFNKHIVDLHIKKLDQPQTQPQM